MSLTTVLGLLSLTIVLSLVFSEAQKQTECDHQKMDETSRWLFFFGDPKRKIPENETERNYFCSEKLEKEYYVKDYAKRCLKAFPHQVTTLLMFGVIRKNKYYCTFNKGKKDIVRMAKCLNTIKSKGNRCMTKLIDEAMATRNVPENLKIGSICCRYYKFEECVSFEAAENRSPHCGHETVVLIEELLEGYTGQMLGHICTQYKRETDQCSKIFKATKLKVTHTNTTRYKSILPPFIEILESVPA